MNIKENIVSLKRQIDKCSGGRPVTFVAVTKTVGTPEMKQVFDAGVTDMAESRAQVLEQKVEELKDYPITWHFIGRLQKNKVKKVVPLVSYIHSVDSVELAEIIDSYAQKHSKKVKVFLQVNVSGEEVKQGFSPELLLSSLKALKNLSNIDIIGLMTMAPFEAADEELQKVFRYTAQSQQKVNDTGILDTQLSELSMGMSRDFCIALGEGATMVRIGSSIFE